MSSHLDAIAGWLADSIYGPSDPPTEPWTPTKLIGTFCNEGQGSAWRTEQRPHSIFHAGFCGFTGTIGFDDGYSMMAALQDSGWRALPEIGDWPYKVYLAWARDEEFALAHYCEGDFAVEVFDGRDAANDALRLLRRADPAP